MKILSSIVVITSLIPYLGYVLNHYHFQRMSEASTMLYIQTQNPSSFNIGHTNLDSLLVISDRHTDKVGTVAFFSENVLKRTSIKGLNFPHFFSFFLSPSISVCRSEQKRGLHIKLWASTKRISSSTEKQNHSSEFQQLPYNQVDKCH